MATIMENLMENIEEMKEKQTGAISKIEEILKIMQTEKMYEADLIITQAMIEKEVAKI